MTAIAPGSNGVLGANTPYTTLNANFGWHLKFACLEQFVTSTILAHRTRLKFQTTSAPAQPRHRTHAQSRAITRTLPHRHRAITQLQNTTTIEYSKFTSSAYSFTCDASRKGNGDLISSQRKGKRGVYAEIAAASTRGAASLRVSRNRKQRVAELQETGMSRSWLCQSFTSPKNTRHWLFPKKPETNCSKS